MYCPAGKATNPISRVLASSLGISCWTPFKPQHSNPNPGNLLNAPRMIKFLCVSLHINHNRSFNAESSLFICIKYIRFTNAFCWFHSFAHCLRVSSIAMLVNSWWLLSRATRRLPFQQLLHRGTGDWPTPFPGLLHFTLDMYLILPSVKQGGIKYLFLSLWYYYIEPRSSGPFSNNLTSVVCLTHLNRYK